MTEEAGIGKGDKLEKRQKRITLGKKESKRRSKTKGRKKRRRGSDGGRRDRQQEAKANVIISSSVGQRAPP